MLIVKRVTVISLVQILEHLKMDDLTTNLDDHYGQNQDVLVEGFVLVLQAILIEKRDHWEHYIGHELDFYDSLTNRKWNKGEAAKILSRDITTWDTSLCSKWLRKFKWSPTQKLSAEERLAIVNLVRVRNDTKHTATSRHVTLEQFHENCKLCQNSLLALQTDPEIIDQILENARNGFVVDQEKLIHRIQETRKEYRAKNMLPVDQVEDALHYLSLSETLKIQPEARENFPSLAESDIVTMRKYCLRESGFWTADNIRQFLDLIEPNHVHTINKGTEKKDFNSNMYRIVRDRPHLATKDNLASAIHRLGYQDLSEKFDKLSFILGNK